MDELKSREHTAGLHTTLRAISASRAEKVFIAQDADVFVRRRVQEVCQQANVPYEYVSDMKALGSAAGLNFKTACAAILKG